MTPILFPYTFIDSRTINRLNRYFQSIVLLQPSSRFVPDAVRREAESRRISLQIPVDTGTERLAAQIRDQRSWAEFMGEKSLKGAGLRLDGIPFFEDGSVQSLRQEIRRASESGTLQQDTNEERLFAARLFLLFAQQYDDQNADLEEKIAQAAELESEMLQSLTGLDRTPEQSAGRCHQAEHLSFLVESRLTHWCRLACEWPVEVPFYVTPNRAAFDELMGDRFSPVLVKKLEATGQERAPVLGEGTPLHQRLEALTVTHSHMSLDVEDGTDASPAQPAFAMERTVLWVYLLPGISSPGLLRCDGVLRDNLCPNTILGVLES